MSDNSFTFVSIMELLLLVKKGGNKEGKSIILSLKGHEL